MSKFIARYESVVSASARRALLKHGQKVRLTAEEIAFARDVFDIEWDQVRN